jgi:DNA-binding NarL/FixJ family response regulator
MAIMTSPFMQNEAQLAETERRRETSPVPPRPLSSRERQVVTLIQAGKRNKEIAFELQLTEGTIKEYLNRIFRKLGVKNRTELAIWAFQHAA